MASKKETEKLKRSKKKSDFFTDEYLWANDVGVFTVFRTLFEMLFKGALFAVGVIAIILAVAIPTKLEDDKSYKSVVIEDKLECISNADSINASFNKFRQETGIVPSIVMISSSEWNSDYDSLERYAYDQYMSLCEGENNWLIVCSSQTGENGNLEWKFGSYKGENTKKILTDMHVKKFYKELETNLYAKNSFTTEQAISKSMEESSEYMMQPSFYTDIWMIVFAVAVVWVIVTFIKFKKCISKFLQCIIQAFKKPEPALAVTADSEVMTIKNFEIKCRFCDGVYTRNSRQECPHCGASTTKEDTEYK